jgi:fructose-1,6-bisphosphatase/inositol monophosphatase family enzyme
MTTQYLQQLLTGTAWDELDYLVIDLPPGTGDIQLTLAQRVPVSGAVIVTTPQDIALLDAKKALKMFEKVEVPVLGIIDQPILQERWLGVDGERSTLNGKPISVRACAGVASAYMYSTAPAMFAGGYAKSHQTLTEKVKLFRWGGDCYAYGLLAAGHVDLVVEADLKLYDYAALIPVITGAGGTITDWQGNGLDMQSEGAVVAAGDPAVHRAALAILSA